MLKKSLRYLFAVLFITLVNLDLNAQEHQERFDQIDLQHYTFDIRLSDKTDKIEVIADVKIRFKQRISGFILDLVKKRGNGKGMSILSVFENSNPIQFEHDGDQISFQIPTTNIGEVRVYQIKYEGVPADGLIISKNKHGDRTFFGDNWPDRAKNWLPTVDHPSDKSTVEWIITAPSHYQSIGNGIKVEDTNISEELTVTRWKTEVPIPTKVMVIGAARFAVEYQGEIDGVSVSSWVYPQDRDEGFYDYSYASPIMDYFLGHVGPYPFQKLANVQSKTRFGGMENAGNIFYSENSIDGKGTAEALVAHEVAHQWFGNSASELNWHHIWLSEGFATYFTNLYIENKYGRNQFVERLTQERNRVIAYSKENLVPIVNTEVTDYMKLLNANSYQKGGWVLHMLRKELGDRIFWKGIRKYYDTYKLSNALSEDLRTVMESVSGKDLNQFFNQWLYKPGQPSLDVSWSSSSKELELDISQTQNSVSFIFPLEVEVEYTDGTRTIQVINVSKKEQKFTLPISASVKAVEIDPNTWLLYELVSLKKR
ncbi:MAG: M1 family metallopeptidase [Bacteroidota bacterium]